MVKEILCLMIGNSRLHWASFKDNKIIKIWHSGHLQLEEKPPELSSNLPIYAASVVPKQTAICQQYYPINLIELAHIPINNLYPTIGIDRALTLWGAKNKYNCPCLVIDAGTALTFSGVNDSNDFIGGAILPGLGLQLRTLSRQTASLPEVNLIDNLPSPWANNTNDAIISGVIYTLLTSIEYFVNTWLQEFPKSKIIITGGDGQKLLSYFSIFNSQLASDIIDDQEVIFLGIKGLIL